MMLTHKGTQRIETERLILRRFTMEDAQAMYDNWAGDDNVTKYLTWPTHSDVGVSQWVLKDWVGSYDKADYYQWAIVPKDLGQPIGSIAVVDHRDDVVKASIGYCMGRQWWHQGIMTETLKAVIAFLMDEVGYRRVEAVHAPENPNSGAVMRKSGMTYEGTLRCSGRNNQGICDEVFYAILAEDRT